MRPSLLDPLFTPVSRLPGIGPRTARTLGNLFGKDAEREPTVADLLFHLPSGTIDRRLRPGIAMPPRGPSSRSRFGSTVIRRRRAAAARPTGSRPMTIPERSPLSSFMPAGRSWKRPIPLART